MMQQADEKTPIVTGESWAQRAAQAIKHPIDEVLNNPVFNNPVFNPKKVRSFMDDFTEFLRQGNMIDLAIGLILGKSINEILNSFIVDIVAPIISLFFARSIANYYAVARCPPLYHNCSSHSWQTWQQARNAGAVTINYGQFFENIIDFLMNAFVLFITVRKTVDILLTQMDKECPQCKEMVNKDALVCKNCQNRF